MTVPADARVDRAGDEAAIRRSNSPAGLPAPKVPPAGDELLVTMDVASLLAVSPETIQHWRHVGLGPKWFRVGSSAVRYRRSAVDRWLAEQEAHAETGRDRDEHHRLSSTCVRVVPRSSTRRIQASGGVMDASGLRHPHQRDWRFEVVALLIALVAYLTRSALAVVPLAAVLWLLAGGSPDDFARLIKTLRSRGSSKSSDGG